MIHYIASAMPSPINGIRLGYQPQTQCLLSIDFQIMATEQRPPHSQTPSVTHQTITQLRRYLLNPHHVFDLNFELLGTHFQKRVWRCLQQIKAGTTKSYGEIAQQLDSSPRAVGNACRRNPLPIIIPCHRVVARNHIGGYSGNTQGELLTIKQWLLTHEQST